MTWVGPVAAAQAQPTGADEVVVGRAASERQLPLAYRSAVVVLKSVLVPLTKRDWRGAENLPRTGGFVVCPNHVSHADPLGFAHFLYDNGHPPYFLAKESLFRLPLLGRWIAATGQIPVYRSTHRAADAAAGAIGAVGDGRCVPIYPEGTITRDPDLWPMPGRTGAARVALATRCPVVPVGQWGAQDILEPYGSRLHLFPRKTLHVLAGPPVPLDDLYEQPPTAAALREATARIMTAITALVADLRGEPVPALPPEPVQRGEDVV